MPPRQKSPHTRNKKNARPYGRAFLRFIRIFAAKDCFFRCICYNKKVSEVQTMVFSSMTFLPLFLPAIFILYFLCRNLRDRLRSSSSVRLSAVRHSLHPFLAKAGTLPDHLYNQSTYIILHFSSACKTFFAQLHISLSVFFLPEQTANASFPAPRTCPKQFFSFHLKFS